MEGSAAGTQTMAPHCSPVGWEDDPMETQEVDVRLVLGVVASCYRGVDAAVGRHIAAAAAEVVGDHRNHFAGCGSDASCLLHHHLVEKARVGVLAVGVGGSGPCEEVVAGVATEVAVDDYQYRHNCCYCCCSCGRSFLYQDESCCSRIGRDRVGGTRTIDEDDDYSIVEAWV